MGSHACFLFDLIFLKPSQKFVIISFFSLFNESSPMPSFCFCHQFGILRLPNVADLSVWIASYFAFMSSWVLTSFWNMLVKCFTWDKRAPLGFNRHSHPETKTFNLRYIVPTVYWKLSSQSYQQSPPILTFPSQEEDSMTYGCVLLMTKEFPLGSIVKATRKTIEPLT